MKRIFVFLSIACSIGLMGCASMSTSGSSEGGVPARIYAGDFDQIFTKALDAVNQCEWQITFTDRTTGLISAKTPTNWLTWGDTISIRLQKLEDNKVKIDMSSGTTGQITDWGRNKENINKFFDTLSKSVSETK